MIVLVSLIVLLRGFPCFHDFSHGAFLHLFHIFFMVRAATRMRTWGSAAPLSRVCLVKWRRSSE